MNKKYIVPNNSIEESVLNSADSDKYSGFRLLHFITCLKSINLIYKNFEPEE